jgi:hypothetical protein
MVQITLTGHIETGIPRSPIMVILPLSIIQVGGKSHRFP